MKHKIALLFTALFMAVGLTWALMPEGEGTTYYVNGAYTGGGSDGTSSKPFTTITAALAAANTTGEGYVTINVAAGEYKEDLTITRGKIKLVGAGQAQTTIGGDSYRNGTHYAIHIQSHPHITISNLKVISNGYNAQGTGTVTWPAIWVDQASNNVDPIIIDQVTIEQVANSRNNGSGIYINSGRNGSTISNVTINGHQNGINVNANTTITNVVLDGKELATSEYGILVGGSAAVSMSKVSVTGYNEAAINYGSTGTSSLTGSTLQKSQNGVYITAGTLNISNTSIYGENAYSPIYVANNRANITLDNQTHLYKNFANFNTLNGFFFTDASATVTDNGASYHYGTNYANSRVVKVSNASGLRNAFPVEMLSLVFASNLGHNTVLTAGNTVLLPAGDPITTATLNIYEAITLEGNNVTLRASDNQANMLLNIQNAHASGTVINNLTITGSAGSGIYTNQAITLSDVTLTKNQRALRIGAAVAVTATNLTTSENTEGGVWLENTGASLNILSGEHIGEKVAIYTKTSGVNTPLYTASLKNNVVKTTGVQWTEVSNPNDKAAYGKVDGTNYVSNFWLRTPSITEPPLPASIAYGEQLWNSVLTGGKVMYDGKEVQGVFQWNSPRLRESYWSNANVVFIPANQKLYAPIEGPDGFFDPVQYYKVTTDVSDRGKIIIKNANPDNYYTNNKQLELIYVPYDGYKVNPDVPTTYQVSGDAVIDLYTFRSNGGAIFVEADRTMVSFDESIMQVYNNGVLIDSDDEVLPGSVLNVVVNPFDSGKALKSLTYHYGTPVLNGLITVGSEPIIIRAEMDAQPDGTFVVGLRQDHNSDASQGIITFHDDKGNIYMPGMAVPSNTLLTPVITPTFGYRLKELQLWYGPVYQRQVGAGTALTIDRDVEFYPVFEAVNYPVTASMDNDAAGSISFNQYGAVTTETEGKNGESVRAYVRISEGYSLLAVIANGKEIRLTDAWRSRPDYVTVQVNGATTIRVITRKLENLQLDQTQQVYTNYGSAMLYPFIPKGVPVGVEHLGAFRLSYREHGSTGTFMPGTSLAGGPVAGAGIYDVRIQRDADEYYNALDIVIEDGLKIVDNYLPLRDMTYTKTNNPARPSFASSAIYDGSVFGNLATNPTTSNNWVVTYRQNGQPVQYPVNAGTYKIIGFRGADTLYHAQDNIELGTFSISQAASNASVTYATDILQGQSLLASRLSGNANIDGAFTWMAPETKMTTAGIIISNKAVFTPYSSNYTTESNLATSLNVLNVAAANLRTITVNLTNPEKGSYSLTRETIPVGPGTIITTGERIRVSFETLDPAYTAILKINGVQYPNGTTYTVGATGDLVISLDFVKIGEAPAIIGITGINLSSLERSVTAGDVFTLTPTIIPSNASDLRVFWTSSDETVATVDADGKVTVHKTGTAVITATTANDYAVSCVLNGHLTGYEEFLPGVQVYSIDKQFICIEAGSPVKVVISDALGRIVYNASVNQRQLVNLPAGTYFVVVADQNTKATVKVVL